MIPLLHPKKEGRLESKQGEGKKKPNVIQHSPGVMKIDFIAVSETFGFYLVP